MSEQQIPEQDLIVIATLPDGSLAWIPNIEETQTVEGVITMFPDLLALSAIPVETICNPEQVQQIKAQMSGKKPRLHIVKDET